VVSLLAPTGVERAACFWTTWAGAFRLSLARRLVDELIDRPRRPRAG
jgi:hypothetical protein